MSWAAPGWLPLWERDIALAAQRRRVAVMQCLAALITGVVAVVFVFLKGGFGDAYRQDPDPFGRSVLAGVLGCLCMVLSFWGPSLTATAITEERERRTLDLLLCTRLTASDIVLGKFLAALVQGVLLVLASAPATAFALWWGGVTLPQLLLGYALVLVYLVLQLSLGLWASARASVAKAAFGMAAGLGMMLFFPSAGSAVVLGYSYAQGTANLGTLAMLGVAALVAAWVTTSSILGAITGVSAVSRDPAPAARKNLVFMVVSALVCAAALGFMEDEEVRKQLTGVLLTVVTLMLVAAALLFLTESAPLRRNPDIPLWWRAGPWWALAWLMAATLVGVGLMPALSLRGMAAPYITPATCAAFAPFVASCAGVAALTRLLVMPRPARRLLALGTLLVCLVGPPVLALISGHSQLELAPSWMMLWLHPFTLVMAMRPQALVGAVGPFGVQYVVSFVVGHFVVASVCLLLGLGLGKDSPRLQQ